MNELMLQNNELIKTVVDNSDSMTSRVFITFKIGNLHKKVIK